MTGCPHDILDRLAAIGPTVAAAGAAVAAWMTVVVMKRTHGETQELQRQIARPLIVVSDKYQNVDVGINWVVELRNVGRSAANIENFKVIAGMAEVKHEGMEPPENYWNGVLFDLGAMRVMRVQANMPRGTNAVAPHSEMLLFDAILQGQPADIQRAMRKLAIEFDYVAPWGERKHVRQSFGG